jgi:hypothetical protein
VLCATLHTGAWAALYPFIICLMRTVAVTIKTIDSSEERRILGCSWNRRFGGSYRLNSISSQRASAASYC